MRTILAHKLPHNVKRVCLEEGGMSATNGQKEVDRKNTKVVDALPQTGVENVGNKCLQNNRRPVTNHNTPKRATAVIVEKERGKGFAHNPSTVLTQNKVTSGKTGGGGGETRACPEKTGVGGVAPPRGAITCGGET